MSRQAQLSVNTQALKNRAGKWIGTIFHYIVLLSLSFVFVYPVLYMFSRSLMLQTDVVDATVLWVPKQLSFANYANVFKALNYVHSGSISVFISVTAALIQAVTCAIAGYGFARYRFPGYALFFGIVVFAFLVPPETYVVPLFIFYSDLGWMNTYYPFIVPTLFGHGLRGALYVLIFTQFFRGQPHELEEAARIDGAGAFKTFWTIMFPLARSAVIVVLLFSIVWHWNDLFQPNLFLQENKYFNLAQMLNLYSGAEAREMTETGAMGQPPLERYRTMAGALVTILPLLILYLFTQRYFVESIERTGIAGD
jgi:multiple sugar transport system permease protein